MSDPVDRWIIHVDMDEFFDAVEKLDNPQLRGKPLLIGGDPRGRGVVSTASYEARVFGCHSAMPMSQAVRLCPQAIVIPGRHSRYGEISEQIFELLGEYSPLVEPLSIDEAFIDITGSQRLLGEPARVAADIKRAIRERIGLTASLGVAPNKFLAKLGSDLKKPDGLVVITPATIHQVLDDLPVTRLWGVGPAAEKVLARLNLRTIGQVRRAPVEILRRALGDAGEHYKQLAAGIDDRPVIPQSQAKSVGQEETFATDVADMEQLRGVLHDHVQRVARRLRAHGLLARTVTLKIRYGDFTTITRSTTLPAATDVTADLWTAATKVLDDWAAKDRRPLRLLGMTAHNLVPAQGQQMTLFEDAAKTKQRAVDGVVDKINQRLGKGSVKRGT